MRHVQNSNIYKFSLAQVAFARAQPMPSYSSCAQVPKSSFWRMVFSFINSSWNRWYLDRTSKNWKIWNFEFPWDNEIHFQYCWSRFWSSQNLEIVNLGICFVRNGNTYSVIWVPKLRKSLISKIGILEWLTSSSPLVRSRVGFHFPEIRQICGC